MESLESKLDRLAPEQMKEVEDFVDFLLVRSGEPQPSPRIISQAPPVLSTAPPPLETVSPSPAPDASSLRMQDHIMRDPLQSSPSVIRPATAPAQESPPAGEDWITRDYIDYGQFESAPSPATEAVKKVKQKISRREEQEKSHQLLDWID